MQGAPSYEEQAVEQQDARRCRRDGLDMAPHLIAVLGEQFEVSDHDAC